MFLILLKLNIIDKDSILLVLHNTLRITNLHWINATFRFTIFLIIQEAQLLEQPLCRLLLNLFESSALLKVRRIIETNLSILLDIHRFLLNVLKLNLE